MKIQLESNNIRSLMENSFSQYGELPAISFVNETPITFRQLKQDISKLMIELLQDGIQAGDRVVILGENSPNWVMAYLAITFLGAVAVPILTGFPEKDVRHIVRDAEVSAIFIAEKYRFTLEGYDPHPGIKAPVAI